MSPVFRGSRRPVTPVREVPTSDDPVREAIAAAPSLHRGEGLGEPPLERLRALVHVSDMGRTGEAGFDTQILLDDEVRDVADVAAGFEDALLRQPGVEAAEGLDREIWVVRTRLALPDVAAAAVRALLELHVVARPRT